MSQPTIALQFITPNVLPADFAQVIVGPQGPKGVSLVYWQGQPQLTHLVTCIVLRLPQGLRAFTCGRTVLTQPMHLVK